MFCAEAEAEAEVGKERLGRQREEKQNECKLAASNEWPTKRVSSLDVEEKRERVSERNEDDEDGHTVQCRYMQ